MKSVSHVIGLVGAILLLLVAVLSSITTVTLLRLGETSRRLAEENLEEQRLLNQFQIVMNDVVIRAAGYARSNQRGVLQDARDALAEAGELAPSLAALSARNDRDGFAADRQKQRNALVTEAATQLDRLSDTLARNEATVVSLALQRLDLIAQDTATLARIDTRLLDEQTSALNRDRQRQFAQGLASTIGAGCLFTGAILAAVVMSHRQLARPLRALEAVVQAVGAGQFEQRVAVRQGFELGRLQAGVNAMAEGLERQRRAIAERTATLEALNTEQGRLLETVSALGTPILPLQDHVLVLPIVGHVDAARADQIENRLLAQVYQQRAQVVILDLTGMAVVDERPLARLLRLRDALTLLGALTIFAGISASLARQLVLHADDLSGAHTYRSLGDALAAVVSTSAEARYVP